MKTITGDSRHNDNLHKVQLIRLMASGDILDPDVWKCILFYPGRSCKKVYTATPLSNDDYNFIKGATLLPAVGMTKTGSVGAVFRKKTEIVLSDSLEYMRVNADGSGKTLEQVIQESVSENASIGYGGQLTDFAPGNFDGSKADAISAGRVATINVYPFESILRVNTRKVGNVDIVWSIVLQEISTEIVDEFSDEKVTTYRVLTYDNSGNYIQKVYTADDKGQVSDEFNLIEPRQDGKPMKHIPFQFFGSESNDYKVDNAPLYPMATLNARHVELSAIRNESVRKLRPTLFGKTPENFDGAAWKLEYPEGLVLASGKSYWGFEGAEIVQATPNESSSIDMARVKEDIFNAASLLVAPQVSGLSTDTVAVQKSVQTNILGVVVRNVESATNLSLIDAQAFMGGSGENSVDINKDFINIPLTPQEKAQWREDVMAGLVTIEEYRIKLEKHGEIASADDFEGLPALLPPGDGDGE